MSNVYVFNAGPTALYLNVNNGPDRTKVAASDVTSWAPGTPAADKLPEFTGGASVVPGKFNVGDNSVDLTLVTGGGTANTSIQIPSSVNPRNDLQLYVFWESTASVSWMLLSDGTPLGGSVGI